jgi:SAM-dependent methyltransferase
MIKCTVCGGDQFFHKSILWPDLIRDWQLKPDEILYIDKQQGTCCNRCGSNYRSMALASAVLKFLSFNSTLIDAIHLEEANNLSILEINEAGTLSPFLKQLKGHLLGSYPELNMHAMSFVDNSIDLIIHSDTLEHVPNPVHALAECCRVLKPSGSMCFTVPIIVGRMSRDRTGLSNSYHGEAMIRQDDYAVQTEFGADVWTYILKAGFGSIEMHCLEYPSALALIARK